MVLNRSIRAAGITLILVMVFCGWWVIASDYDYGALSGTYTFNGSGESSTLVLKPDRTFWQELQHDGKVDHATGTWHRFGLGGAAFSKEFLRLPRQQSYRDKFGPDPIGGTNADQEFGAHFDKLLGLYPSLRLDAVPVDIRLRKRLIH